MRVTTIASHMSAAFKPLIDWNRDIITVRALEATYWDADAGLFKVVNVDSPRILKDGFLYVEGARTNLVPDHDEATLFAGSSIASNTATSPDGTLSAERRSATSAGGYIRQDITMPGGGLEYAGSIFAKFESGDVENQLLFNDPGFDDVGYAFNASGVWERQTGLVTSTTAGNGQFRVRENGPLDDASIFIWGWQLEEGGFPSQLIRTWGTSATRPADAIHIPTENVPPTMRSGRWRFKIRPAWASTDTAEEATATLFSFFSGTDDRIYFDTTVNRIRVRQGAVTRVSSNVLTWSRNQELTVSVDSFAGTIEVSGATSGDGKVTSIPWAMPVGDLLVGNIDGLNRPFFGAISEPTELPVPSTPPISGTAIDLNPGSSSTVVISGEVDSLADDSGNSLDATPAAAANRPTFIYPDPDFGNRASMLFDGVDDGLATPDLQPGATGGTFTVYGVIKTGTIVGRTRIIGNNIASGTGRFAVWQDGEELQFEITQPGTDYTRADVQIGTSNPVRFSAVFDVTQSGAAAIPSIYINGVLTAPVFALTDSLANAQMDTTAWGVGANVQASSQFFDGKIARIAAYNAAHTADQIEATDAWMAEYYDLSTPPIAGASIDLNPDSINTVVISGAVDTLADESINGLDATQATANKRPAFIYSDPELGNRASMLFDGVDDGLATPLFQPGGGGTDWTVYGVIKTGSAAGDLRIFGQDTGSGTGRFDIEQGGGGIYINFRYSSPGTTYTIKRISVTPNTVYRFVGVFDASDGPNAVPSVYINGAIDAGTLTATAGTTDTEFDDIASGVGSNPGGSSRFFDGKIARLIGYDAAHTATQITEMDTWLANHFKLERSVVSVPPIAGAAIDLNPESPNTEVIAGAVSVLADGSGNGLSASQGTSTKRPVFTYADPEFGGHSLTFDGTDDGLAIPSFQPGGGGSDFTLYGVFKTGSLAALHAIFYQFVNAGTGRISFRTNAGFLEAYFSNPGGSYTYKRVAISPDTVYRFAVVWDVTTGADSVPLFYLNGVDAGATYALTLASDDTDMDGTDIGIGSSSSTTAQNYDGKIARLIGYNEAHDANQIALMDAWLDEHYTPSPVVPLLNWNTRATTTRSLEATYWDETAETFDVFGVDVPRVLSDGSIYVEGERRNLVLTHHDLDGATIATLTPDNSAAPDGTTTADRLTVTGANGYGYTDITLTSGNTHNVSAWLYYVSGDPLMRIIGNGGGFAGTGQTNATLTPAWVRYDHTPSSAAAGATTMRFQEISGTNDNEFDIWGIQIEEGEFPSQLVRTAGVETTRPADDVVVASAGVPAAMKSGTWFVKIRPERASTEAADAAEENLFTFGGADDRIYIDSATNQVVVRAGAATAVASPVLTWARNQELTLKFDSVAGSIRVTGAATGSGSAIGTAWTMPAGDMQVGNSSALTSPFFGAIGQPYTDSTPAPADPPATADLVAQYLAEDAVAGATFTIPNAYGVDATQSTGADQPTITTHPDIGDVLSFDGAGDHLSMTGVTSDGSTAYTTFAILDIKTSSSFTYFCQFSAGQHNIGTITGSTTWQIADGSSNRYCNPAPTGLLVSTLICDGTEYVPYVGMTEQTASVTSKVSRTLGGTAILGGNTGGTQNLHMDFGCFLVWKRRLTEEELQELWDWAAAKWPGVGL